VANCGFCRDLEHQPGRRPCELQTKHTVSAPPLIRAPLDERLATTAPGALQGVSLCQTAHASGQPELSTSVQSRASAAAPGYPAFCLPESRFAFHGGVNRGAPAEPQRGCSSHAAGVVARSRPLMPSRRPLAARRSSSRSSSSCPGAARLAPASQPSWHRASPQTLGPPQAVSRTFFECV
jgi:hypothetical protein